MGHPTSFLPGEIEQMADQPAKVRTAAQQAANQAGKNAAAWLAAKGLSKQIPYLAMVKKMKKEGKSSTEIEAAVKAKINNNTRARANKKAAPKNGTKKNNGAAAKANNGTKKNNAAAKMRTPAQLAANAKMRNTAAAMKAKGIKFTPASFKNYKAAKLAGRSNDDIFAEFKDKYPAVNAEGKPIVAKRAVTAKAPKAPTAIAAAPLAVNAPAGSYVCDRCRLVTKNATRKNNTKANNVYNFGNPGFYYGQ